MHEALKMIALPKNIETAYLTGEGDLAEVLAFIKNYERGDWIEVGKAELIDGVDLDKVYAAYCQSYRWYRDMFY